MAVTVVPINPSLRKEEFAVPKKRECKGGAVTLISSWTESNKSYVPNLNDDYTSRVWRFHGINGLASVLQMKTLSVICNL
jgi:hypothetical protein